MASFKGTNGFIPTFPTAFAPASCCFKCFVCRCTSQARIRARDWPNLGSIVLGNLKPDTKTTGRWRHLWLVDTNSRGSRIAQVRLQTISATWLVSSTWTPVQCQAIRQSIWYQQPEDPVLSCQVVWLAKSSCLAGRGMVVN